MNRDGDKGKILDRRTAIIAGGKFLLLSILTGRMYYLQVLKASKYKMLADENRISIRLLAPPRGIIYDRNHTKLAINQQNFQALLIPEQTKDIKKTLDIFSKLTPLKEEQKAKILKDIKKQRSFVPVTVKDNIPWEDMAKIQVNAPDLPGIIIDEGLRREYPHKEQLAHFLGYVAAVSEKDKKDDPLLNLPNFRIGKSGIEKTYDKELRGKSGNQKLEVNSVGRVIKEIEKDKGASGKDLHTTIDLRLQKLAYELMGEESASAIIMDIHTGEVLTLASTPAFDPNDFNQGLSNKTWKDLIQNHKNPLINKSISGLYSPGSTFKMIVALAALEAGVITANTKIYCNGAMNLGNHRFHCWKDEGHGLLNLEEALQHSCDIYFYEIAQRVGIDKIAEMADKFGLGKKLGLEIEGEKAGLIPNRNWKMGRYGEAWQKGETLISGIGQGYVLTTPIQLAVMTSRLANGGYQVNAKFVKDPEEDIIEKEELDLPPKINVSKRNFDIVKRGMYKVLNEQGGTAFGSRVRFKGQKVSGKTGTTQVRRISMKERETGVLEQEELKWLQRNHALFVGYAPHDKPKYSVTIVVEHGGSGSRAAAPIGSKLLKEALRLQALDKENKGNKNV